jgi:hypothetical protein
MYFYIFAIEAQCNTSHALYPILHDITSLGSNPRPPASAALAPPPGRDRSPLGVPRGDPSHPPRHRGQAERMDLPPVVIRSRRAASVPLPLAVSPGASGPALPLPPAPPLSLPSAQLRGCGGSMRGHQAAAPLELLESSRAAALPVNAGAFRRVPPPRRAAAGPPRTAPASTLLHHAVLHLASLAWQAAPSSRLYPWSVCCCFLFFSDQRSDCVALPFVTASSSTLPRMRLSLRPHRLQRRRS